jgi:hypothetical protein
MMTESEWKSLAKAINSDIAGLSRAASVQAEVRQTIKKRLDSPTEEQFIDEDAFGQLSPAPRTVWIDGHEVKIWKVHRTGLNCSDVKGADLYYELGDRKFALIQYKSPSPKGRVTLDVDQLNVLENACPVACPPTSRFGCGSWYAIRSTTRNAYFTACEARALFGKYSSRDFDYFVNGLTKEQFQQEFSRCHIGARTRPIDILNYRENALERNRVFIHVKRIN